MTIATRRAETEASDPFGVLAYGIHSAVNKVLIVNREIVPGRMTVVLVDQVLGF